ncbi:MAG: restriction endonuclease subunit S [Turicibacter sp.]|nr:restriction endonuclease subunit S [Turicibacter sp.]
MTNLDNMIAELCPNGVEFVAINDLIIRMNKKVKNNQNLYPVLTVSNTKGLIKSSEYREHDLASADISNYTIVEPGYFAYNPARLNIGSISWQKENWSGCVSPMYAVFDINTSKILHQYLWLNVHSPKGLQWIDSNKELGARFRFDFDKWKKFLIPLPPLEIQAEIVRILNNFTELTAELAAELTARKKQYEYYRNFVEVQ